MIYLKLSCNKLRVIPEFIRMKEPISRLSGESIWGGVALQIPKYYTYSASQRRKLREPFSFYWKLMILCAS